jgi:hypothetical protein
MVFCVTISGYCQSKVMENLSETYEDASVLVFYYSTMKMLIPEDKQELRDLIYNVEKIKVLMVDSLTEGKQKISEIKAELEKDGFDEAMSIRHEENNIIVYIKEKNGITKGFFLLMEEDYGLTAIDLVGEFPLNKINVLTDNLDLLKDPRNLGFN